EEALCERLRSSRLEGLGERVDDLRGREHVPRCRVPLARPVRRGGDAGLARERGRAAEGVYRTELAHVAARVAVEQPVEGLPRREALAEKPERRRAVPWMRERLRHDCADARLGVR